LYRENIGMSIEQLIAGGTMPQFIVTVHLI